MNFMELWYSWVDSKSQSDLERLATLHPNVFTIFDDVYITCIDSGRSTEHLEFFRTELEKDGYEAEMTSNGVRISASDFVRLAQSATSAFNGFDEVWLFKGSPSRTHPEDLRITSEAPITAREAGDISTIADWMRSANCVLGLGDGCGLNYLTTDQQLVDLLESNK